MNGILIVDKPSGWTSFDVIAKLRGILGTRKLGHSGTLDPMATGVLPVFAGGASKAVDMQPDHTKAYRALIRFGIATDTGDVTGTVLRSEQTAVTEEQLRAVLPRFTGDILQTPPMYSAVKVNGSPLYKLARQGVTVERKARPVTIHRLEVTGREGEQDFVLEVDCSKGTYVRTLVEDLGEALGVPATLAGLRRTRAGVFGLEHSHTLEEIQAAKDENRLEGLGDMADAMAHRLEELLLPVETVFAHLPQLTVSPGNTARLLNGAPCYRIKAEDGVYRLQGPEGFLGLGRVTDSILKTEKLFVERT